MDQKQKKLLQFRAPESLSDAIEVAARRDCQSKSEFVRQSVIERLRNAGIDPSTFAAA